MVGKESTTKNVRSHPEPINWSLRELEGVLGNFVKGSDATAAGVIRAQAMAQKMIKDKEENRYKTVQGTTRCDEGTANDDQQTNQSKEKAWVEVTKGG